MSERIIEVDAKPTQLDHIVYTFVRLVEKYTKYVLVSGYTSILLGNERPTHDIDILVSGFTGESEFKSFLSELKKKKMKVATAPEKMLYNMVEKDEEPISIFTDTIWYFDFKKAKTKWDFLSIQKYILVRKGELEFKISAPEIQIPYKLYLGSDKDIKDAAFLYTKLRKIINTADMKAVGRSMKVDLSIISGENK